MSIAPTEAPVLVLNASNRCDACGSSRAYVLAILPGLAELYFCAHDWNRHKDAIAPMLVDLIDETGQLTEHIKDSGHVH
jgi:hypothetical protein